MRHFRERDLRNDKKCNLWRLDANREDLIHYKNPKQGLGTDQFGYGKKLETNYKISFEGREYKVWAGCFSNVACIYFKSGGRDIYIS
jgi:hypothetical protein